MIPAPHCRTCRAEIRFVRMVSGRTMPTGLIPDPAGTIAARWDGHTFTDGRVIRAGDPPPPAGWKRFRPHWADCEKAGRGLHPDKPAPKPLPESLF